MIIYSRELIIRTSINQNFDYPDNNILQYKPNNYFIHAKIKFSRKLIIVSACIGLSVM